MGLILLEALLALAILVAIVWCRTAMASEPRFLGLRQPEEMGLCHLGRTLASIAAGLGSGSCPVRRRLQGLVRESRRLVRRLGHLL